MQKENKLKEIIFTIPRRVLSGICGCHYETADFRQKPSEERNKLGFTLIELLVVVLIIGILAAVAVPQYQLAVDKAKTKGIFPMIRHIRDAEMVYKLANGFYTTNFDDLSIDLPVLAKSSDGGQIRVSGTSWAKGISFSLSCSGTYCHVFARPLGRGEDKPEVYWAFSSDWWLCYPKGTTRGKRLCKGLGCSDTSGLYCSFKP